MSGNMLNIVEMQYALDVVAEWSKVLITGPWPLMV